METLTSKISRLQKLNLILTGMIAVRDVFEVVEWRWHDSLPSQNPQLATRPVRPAPSLNQESGDEIVKRFLEAQQKCQEISAI